jgi:putative ATPase
MRPRTVDEFVGQEHFFGPGKLLRRMLQADRLSSLIFYGPPGTGKTALAQVIANHTKSRFRPLNATSTGTKEVRELLAEARKDLEAHGERTILFLDEIHRFNKAQQDVLLPDVEEGIIILIGATTQNPFFAINTPLLSRSQIFTFEPLSREQIKTLIRRALADKERGLGQVPVDLHDDALEFLAEMSDGDARRALTALEVGVLSMLETSSPSPPVSGGEGRGEGGSEGVNPLTPDPSPPKRGRGEKAPPVEFTLEVAQDSIQRKVLEYDPTGDAHYDLASAFIKSMRGSDPDAAIYWLARMLEAGEDPRFVARRCVIFASEDVGNADPRALSVAIAAAQAVEFVGLPECQLNLAHAVTYLATAPKSNASYIAIAEARSDVQKGRTVPVPKHLKDAHYRGAKEAFEHGVGYQYAHDFEGGWVDQEYLGVERTYYEPTDRGYEAEIRARLEEIRSQRQNKTDAGDEPPPPVSDAPEKRRGKATGKRKPREEGSGGGKKG